MQPGESGKIPIKINSKRGGPIAKSINVYTNVEGVDATIRLKLKGTVWEAIQASPRSASFGRIASAAIESGKGTKVVSIINNVDGAMKLTDVVSSNPAFSADVEETVQGKQAKVTVKIVKPLKQGSNRGTITMKTGIKDKPTLTISVSAHLAPELEVRPRQFTIFPNRQSSRPYSVLISNNGKKPVKITDLAVSNADFKVALSEKKPGELFGITLEMPEGYKLTGDDRVTFKTSHPSFPMMTVPIIERGSRPAGGNIRTTRQRTPRSIKKPTGGPAAPQAPAVGKVKAGAASAEAKSAKAAAGDRKGTTKAAETGKASGNNTSNKERVAEPTAPSPTRKTEGGNKAAGKSGKVKKLNPSDKERAGSNTKPAG